MEPRLNAEEIRSRLLRWSKRGGIERLRRSRRSHGARILNSLRRQIGLVLLFARRLGRDAVTASRCSDCARLLGALRLPADHLLRLRR